ncbi:hypothetical protein CLU79DRAFT_765374 [Phycomyces nitens]|nr:hypothetical protein CLU79DRAFT_765374 [Phycomyces nitens]
MQIPLLLLLSIISVSGYLPEGRISQVCEFVKDAIYCLGGGEDIGVAIYNRRGHFSLDLSKQFELNSDSYNAWKDISISSDGFILGPSCDAASAALPNNRYIVFGGGNCEIYTELSYNPIVFDAITQKWTPYHFSGLQQNFQGFGVYVSHINKVYFWGGKSTTKDTNKNADPIFYTFDVNNLSAFVKFTVPLGDGMMMPGAGQSVLGPDNKTIYHFGGWDGVYNPADGNFTTNASSFSALLLFNTEILMWSTVTVGPYNIPSSRTLLTATLLPNSTSFLIYGGVKYPHVESAYPYEDYAYLFDTVTNSWSLANISDTNGAGPRYGHSAVLHPNGDLFIIFGVDRNQVNRDDYYILDTNDIHDLKWKTTFTPSSLIDLTPTNSTNTTNSTITPEHAPIDIHRGISGGAIAGIAVGCVAALAIVGLLLWFLKRKRGYQKEPIHKDDNVPGMESPIIISPINQEGNTVQARIYQQNILNGINNKPDASRIVVEPVNPRER